MKTREDEIRYLIYLKGQLIKQTKKEIQNLTYELKTIEGTKRLEKKKHSKKKLKCSNNYDIIKKRVE